MRSLMNDDRLWNEKALVLWKSDNNPNVPKNKHKSNKSNITLYLVPCIRLTLNCCSFPVSAHVSVLAASRLPLQLFGTPFLWPFVVVSPLTVFGANSKLSSITLLSGLLNAPLHPAPQIRRVSRWHCALYKFTYLLTYFKNNVGGAWGPVSGYKNTHLVATNLVFLFLFLWDV